MTGSRKWDLDVIRIAACYFVILIHVLADTGEITQACSVDWVIYHVFTCIVRCAVPVFFMLSGVLFMEKKVSVKQLYTKYVLRIAVSLIAWSVFYAWIDYIKDGNGNLRYFIIRVLSRHYHLWFLPAVLGVYICLPVLQQLILTGSQSLIRYTGAVVLVAVIGKTTLDPFLDYFFNPAVWDSFWRDMGLSDVSTGIIFFVLGYYLYKYRENISCKWCLGLSSLMIFLMSVLDMFFSLKIGEHTGFSGDLLSIWVTVFSAAVFVLMCRILSEYRPEKRMGRMLRTMSECTFGIYLVHVFLLESLYPFFQAAKISYVFFILSFSAVLFFISFGVVWCIRRIPLAGKWIV